MGHEALKYLSSFGRTHSKHVSSKQKQLFQNLLPLLAFDPKHMPNAPMWLEIGYGGGEHLAHQAENNPQIFFVGCEVFDKGIAQMLQKIEQKKFKNIHLFTEDARLLLEKLPEESIDRVFILFPDPWPKSRHHKRRIISTTTLDMLARVMKSGSILRLVTDWPDYAKWMLIKISAHGKFKWLAESKTDWETPPQDHTVTRYQQKALREGRHPVFLEFKLQ